MESTHRLAHISEDKREQTILAHLNGTADLAGRFASAFDSEAEARFAGEQHDRGKYSSAFQHRLKGGPPTDHSTAGAQYAMAHRNIPAAFAIAGHHSGIPDGGNGNDSADTATLLGRQKRNIEPTSPWDREIPETQSAPPTWVFQDNVTSMFYTRMLYSCLVDADFIDTETFMNGVPKPRGTGEAIPILLEKVRAKAQAYQSSPDDSIVVQQRNAVLKACQQHGRHGKQGLYTLTVPTGGGKTFASLAFALEHAAQHHLDRVFYVIPYTSIIDQTAQTFSALLGEENVLAHFSSVDYRLVEQENLTPLQYRQLLSSENWDAPIVVTTAVQFFESLYSNRSSRCRKLHNIANSVVVFDEAQTLPNDYLMPCLSAIAQLVQHYHTTAVLCTATQPALESLFRDLAPGLAAEEISPNPEQLYETLRRVTLDDIGTLSKKALAGRLCSHSQVLCVVNRRKTAQDLFAQLPSEGSYCLTTLLCAADRRAQLTEIRLRLKQGLPCRVVSTSLIEAGVDVDFPAAYREQAGLDSLLQTAGRCNRNGMHPAAESPVFLFRLEDCPVPSTIAQNVNALNYITRHFPTLDTPEAIRCYFEQLYSIRSSLDAKEILFHSNHGIEGCAFPFSQIAEAFQLIETPTQTIYLPLDEGAALCDRLRHGAVNRTLLRQLGVYSVSCYSQQFNALDSAGVLEHLPNGAFILSDLSQYSRKTGLSMDVETGIGFFY